MTTAIATRAEAPAASVVGFSREQLDLLKRTVADGTSDDEFALFVEVARTTGLNPFQRQVYAIMREAWNPVTKRREPKMTIQTGIDGYRLIAARTGLHAGTSDAEYGPVGDKGWPQWARVTVRRLLPNGVVADFTATARWDEYVQTNKEGNPAGQWPKMPYLMLAKCAEALALRKAFPAELSGVYTAEEMSQADSALAQPQDAEQPRKHPGKRERARQWREQQSAAEAADEFSARGDASDAYVPEDRVFELRATAVVRGASEKFLAWFDSHSDGPITEDQLEHLRANLDRHFPPLVGRAPGEEG